MADKPESPEPFSLKRWSQRKREAARGAPVVPAAETPMPTATAFATAPAAAEMPDVAPLPPVESLTFDSDFAAFMQPKVNEDTKRAALKKLFTDPSFNMMDGLDIYTGDYTQPDPMPAGMLDKLSTVYAMLDPVPLPEDEARSDGAEASAAPPYGAPVAPPDGDTEVRTPQASADAGADAANKPA
jgi:Protein of unknown function (DUF3306)